MTTWQPMKTAPRDGTLIQVRHVSKAHGELIFTTRWLAPRRVWVDWDRQHVALTKLYLTGWRPAAKQFRAWTAEEEAALAELHGPEGVTWLDPAAWALGLRRPVASPSRPGSR